jgi:amidohydrolase
MNGLDLQLDLLLPDMVKWRRYLHQNPELSYQEEKTSAFVASLLREWGVEVRERVGGYGVVATIRGTASNSVATVALRADMDALPIQDEKDCEYRSQVPQTMHACGHDAHTSSLLAVCKAMQARRGELSGTIVALFQPAEELSPGGALPMIQAGALEGVDAIFGVHLWTPLPVGVAAAQPGPMMAAADEFTIEIKGKGGHGGLPHETVDSIVAAAHLVVNLQTIVSRNINPAEPAVISIGSIHAGSSFNAIAGKTVLSGTVRSFDEHVRTTLRNRIETVATQTCAMFGATVRFDYKLGYPSVVNDAKETERFYRIAKDVFGEGNVMTCPSIMAAEDFAYYLQHIPGCFMMVGAGDPQGAAKHPHHHPLFDIDETAMVNSSKLLARMALDYFRSESGDPASCGV